jgi:hypothetical protein
MPIRKQQKCFNWWRIIMILVVVLHGTQFCEYCNGMGPSGGGGSLPADLQQQQQQAGELFVEKLVAEAHVAAADARTLVATDPGYARVTDHVIHVLRQFPDAQRTAIVQVWNRENRKSGCRIFNPESGCVRSPMGGFIGFF